MSAEATDPVETTPEGLSSDPQPEQAAEHAHEAPAEMDPIVPPMPAEPPPPPEPVEPPFDIRTVEPLSFAAIENGRQSIFSSFQARDSFTSMLESMSETGEEGRRRALGWWVLGNHERCAKELVPHKEDPTAAYTLAQSLIALHRHQEANDIFTELTGRFPDEPRPRAGLLETRLLLAGDADPLALASELEQEVVKAPGGFADSADGQYIQGRIAELRREWESALDNYERARGMDPGHYDLLSHFAHLAERCGLDELAIELYEAILSLYPGNRSVLMNLGVLYEDAGRDADAAACYDTVVSNSPADAHARLYLRDAQAAMEMYYDEDMEKKEDRLNQILRIPITDFELSVRARNCLNKMQITTLGDLVQRTEQELLSYKNFGETSLHEIKEILHSKGLRLGMPREEAVASIEAHAHRARTGENSDVLNKPVLELQLSIRARRTVETLGCLTVGDITKHSAEELLGMPNFGQTSLQELRSKLGELGIKLKGD